MLTVNAALTWAKKEAECLPVLTGNPPRTKAARTVEALARRVVSLPKGSKERGTYTAALLEHLTPLIRQTFFTSSVRHKVAIELDDYMQEVYARTLVLLDRYYKPEKGNFPSYAVMAMRQSAGAVETKQAKLEAKETLFTDHSSPYELPGPPDKVADPDATTSPVLTALNDFVDWLKGSDSPLFMRYARVALIYCWSMTHYKEYPSNIQVAEHLGVSGQKANYLKQGTLQMFRDYLCAYDIDLAPVSE